jgi:hypothetical protein
VNRLSFPLARLGALLSLAGAGSAQAACFVKADATGLNNGSTWADAYNDLQSALSSPPCDEVWVAAGTYTPGASRSDSFVIRPGTAVYGGFSGAESSRSTADRTAHVTANPATGSPTASGGIVDCDEATEHCIAGYPAEPTAPSIVLDLTPAQYAHIDNVFDLCGLNGEPAGSLVGNTYTIPEMTGDCAVLASFALDEFAVGGEVSGLVGSGLSLLLNGSENLPISANGSFAFATPFNHGESYTVTVAGSPSQPAQTCTISNGKGSIDGANVANVQVSCTTNTYSIGGTLSGLLGSGLALQLGSETLPINTNGGFAFVTAVASGESYSVSIASQPELPAQICSVEQSSGTVTDADITDIAVSCRSPKPSLVLTLDNGRDHLRYGRVVDYVVTLRNEGEGAATNVDVSALFSPAFDVPFAQWQCFGGGSGASCLASGTGALADTVTLPPDRSLTWLVRVPVLADTEESIASFTATAAGAQPATLTDTDTLVITRDGFDEPYADGSPMDAAESSKVLEGDANYSFTLPPHAANHLIDDVLVMRTVARDVSVQRIVFGDSMAVRLRYSNRTGDERASMWSAAQIGDLLTIGSVGDDTQRWLLLEGASTPVLLESDAR